MSEIIISILSASAVSTILSAGLFWLTKSWISERIKGAIQTEYQQKLETHKAQLKAESDVTLERLKSKLQITAAERQIRYSRVFERTAETAATTYQKLLAFHDAVQRYTATIAWCEMPEKAERRKAVNERNQEFWDYFRPRSLYLPKEMTQRINDVWGKLFAAKFSFECDLDKDGGNSHIENRETWVEVRNIVIKEVPELLTLLEDHFRELLGIIERRQQGY